MEGLTFEFCMYNGGRWLGDQRLKLVLKGVEGLTFEFCMCRCCRNTGPASPSLHMGLFKAKTNSHLSESDLFQEANMMRIEEHHISQVENLENSTSGSRKRPKMRTRCVFGARRIGDK